MAQFTPGLQKDGTFKNHFGFLWFFPAVDPIHNPFFSTTCCFYPCTDIPVSLFCPVIFGPLFLIPTVLTFLGSVPVSACFGLVYSGF